MCLTDAATSHGLIFFFFWGGACADLHGRSLKLLNYNDQLELRILFISCVLTKAWMCSHENCIVAYAYVIFILYHGVDMLFWTR